MSTLPLPHGPIRRICVVRFGGMGDILLATPAVRALARYFGTSDIDFIVGRGMKPALDGISYLNNVIEFDKEGADARLSRFLPTLAQIRARHYDLFVNFQPSAKTFLMSWASRAPYKISFRKDRRRQLDTGRVRHAVDDFTKELASLGIEHVDDRSLDFIVPPEATISVTGLLASEGIAPDATLLAINPAATRDVNRWPPAKFTAFLNALPARLPQVIPVLTGAKGDVELTNEIASATQTPVHNLAGRINVKELGALLHRADVFLTADTGPMHIGSAVGAPLVVLSGAADPDRTGPLGRQDLVVINRELSCVPCQARTCRRGDIACMTQMPVEWVLNAVEQRLMGCVK